MGKAQTVSSIIKQRLKKDTPILSLMKKKSPLAVAVEKVEPIRKKASNVVMKHTPVWVLASLGWLAIDAQNASRSKSKSIQLEKKLAQKLSPTWEAIFRGWKWISYTWKE